jgi:hypothetical protein
MKTLAFRMIAGLLAIGSAFCSNYAHAQAAGSLDPTFGKNGIVTTTFSGQTVTPIGAVEQSNGDIVVVSQFDFMDDEGTGRVHTSGQAGHHLLGQVGVRSPRILASFSRRCGLGSRQTGHSSLPGELRLLAHKSGPIRDLDQSDSRRTARWTQLLVPTVW